MPAPSTDLCTVADVTAFIGQTVSTAANTELQALVSAASLYITSTCSVDNFNSASYTEDYSGNDSHRLYLRNWPISAVASLTVNGVAISPSTAWNQAGFVFDRTGILLRGATRTFPGIPPGRFPRGIKNITVVYTAGFETMPPDLAQAAIEIAANTYVRGQNPYKASSSSSVPGATGNARFGLEVPLTAQQTIRNYQRVWGTSN